MILEILVAVFLIVVLGTMLVVLIIPLFYERVPKDVFCDEDFLARDTDPDAPGDGWYYYSREGKIVYLNPASEDEMDDMRRNATLFNRKDDS